MSAPDASGWAPGEADQGAAGSARTHGDPGGVSQVEAALSALAEVAERPPQEQVEPLARAQAALAETLDSVGDL